MTARENQVGDSKMADRCICKMAANRGKRHIGHNLSNRGPVSLFLLLRIAKTNLKFGGSTLFWIAAAILMCVGHANGQEQKFAMQPEDQTAVLGSRVTLPCRVINKSGDLQWTKDDFGLGIQRNLSGYDRYSMIGSDEEGDFSLDIFPVQLDDDAKYQCQVRSGTQGQAGIRSKFARLSVSVPPEAPRILQGPVLYTTEDQTQQLECVSEGGKPAAEITWIDSDGSVLKAVTKVLPMSDGRRYTARSMLTLLPKRRHHLANITCQAQNTADRMERQDTIQLQVKYAPVVSVKITSGVASNGRIPEGAEVRLGCKAEANPNGLTYKWFLNDEPVIGDYTTEMIIFNVSRKHHDSIVKCEVHNSVGKSEESESLDVTYGPRFKTLPVNVEADLGSAVTLSCDVDGNPMPEITWLHKDQDRWSVVGSTPNLTLTVDTSTTGKYNCRAAVQGFPEIQATAMVLMNGPPIVVSHRIQMGVEGESAKVECRVVAVPKPKQISWVFNGKEIDTHEDQDYTITEDELADGICSTLIIKESRGKHFGDYNCTVTNEYGTDNVTISLKRESAFYLMSIDSPTTLAYGSLTALVLILLLTSLSVWRARLRKRQPPSTNKRPDVMADAAYAERSSCDSLKLDLNKHDNPEYSIQDFKPRLPLAGPVSLPIDRNSQYGAYSFSNDYSDHGLPPNLEYKDGHNNNGYSEYRSYSPPVPLPHITSPIMPTLDTHSANRVYLPTLQSSTQLSLKSQGSLSGSLPRSQDLGGMGTLPLPGRGLEMHNSVGLPTTGRLMGSNTTLGSATYDSPLGIYHQNGIPLRHNGGTGLLTSNGIDRRFAATYGNPYLRTPGDLSTVNTANPAATPAPPPYNSLRNSGINMVPSGSIPHISSPSMSTLGSIPQPQQASGAMASPVGQMVQLSKKGNAPQQKLATHV